MGHLDLKIVFGALWQRSQAFKHVVRGCPHHRKRHAETSLRKGRLHHVALTLPLRSVGGEDTFTQQGFQGIAQELAFRKIGRPL